MGAFYSGLFTESRGDNIYKGGLKKKWENTKKWEIVKSAKMREKV